MDSALRSAASHNGYSRYNNDGASLETGRNAYRELILSL
jgi:hypothetical protein